MNLRTRQMIYAILTIVSIVYIADNEITIANFIASIILGIGFYYLLIQSLKPDTIQTTINYHKKESE